MNTTTEKTTLSLTQCDEQVQSEAANATPTYEREVARYLAEASTIPDAEVRPCRTTPQVVLANARTGVAAVNSPEIIERIRKELPKIDIDRVLDIGRLADAFAFAARQPEAEGKEDLREVLDCASSLRKQLIPQLEVLVACGIVKRSEYEPLRVGHGPVALGSNLIDGAEILERYACQLQGKLAVEPGFAQKARAAGQRVMSRVLPSGAPKPVAARDASVQVRDRLWTLLLRRHADLRRVGYYLWLEEAFRRIPGLRTFHASSRKASAPASQPEPEVAVPVQPQPT